ncbi:hypothetical protein PHLGIDRAFT_120482 [Phlebiopsis gigantea 11061_1 CR5-6]|uniref:Uncharacterized protein n=1 Tax=Phlebiopsis gigantea (strain 11061_1 CR5-6) TaxID=745531 RepID=A0A0C3PG75_PHLG1|nr:hypothetical protein PHLGIDRAFT_120482 [Phlebiopsis gigantea 11061_1 CR5-6]
MAAPVLTDSAARSVSRALPVCEAVTLCDEHSQPWTDTYVRALALAPNVAQMCSLDVDSLCAWNEEHLGSLLGRIGGSLRHLGLQLTTFDDPGGKRSALGPRRRHAADTRAFCASLNLAACRGLAHLSIKFNPAPLMALSWTGFAHVVNTVPYAALRRLSLHLGLPFARTHAARARRRPGALPCAARARAGGLVRCRPGWERWRAGPEADAIRRAFPRVGKKATISFTLAGRWRY